MPLPKEDRYTYADILSWDDGKRYELYEGQIVALASPTDSHQRISMELSRQIANFLLGKSCEVFAAPFDVRLFEKDNDDPEDVDTVLQPDLVVVCGQAKVDRHGVHGVPAMVVEISSDSTRLDDWRKKLKLQLNNQSINQMCNLSNSLSKFQRLKCAAFGFHSSIG